ncbi:peptidoglycan editing factor PgeF [Phosphitispora fastidiosa]|uniref:peptidoglycan editing factor PgeF n=1 Tax=Phosphitispora fastidiosa TaxID=2837202 RepID=UPI001E2FB560|nr:peptidoglycan editing factor PgeF [Phosphitispora fastidiosa]MBU7008601.1 YfiH family protein [Phosphitispora fastidiosa]
MEQGFIQKAYGNIVMLEIPSFNRSGLVKHGFSTRNGGAGKNPYNTLNLACHVGDYPETVIKNRQEVCRALEAEIEQMVTAQQVHSSVIRVVGQEHAGAGAFSYDTALPDTDGLVTNVPGVLLATFYADCVPLFIMDPVKRVIASVHAGWKGTLSGIGAEALKKMAQVFGSNPRDCLAGIGPAIGRCCYEVDVMVSDRFRHQYDWCEQVLNPGADGRVRLDLPAANRNILVQAGIRSDNVEMSHICTSCNQDMLFSYRGSQGVTGRMGAFIMLRK